MSYISNNTPLHQKLELALQFLHMKLGDKLGVIIPDKGKDRRSVVVYSNEKRDTKNPKHYGKESTAIKRILESLKRYKHMPMVELRGDSLFLVKEKAVQLEATETENHNCGNDDDE